MSMHSKTWTFFEGKWHEGNVPIMGPRTHGAWLCSSVFDGARCIRGRDAGSGPALCPRERLGKELHVEDRGDAGNLA